MPTPAGRIGVEIDGAQLGIGARKAKYWRNAAIYAASRINQLRKSSSAASHLTNKL
jgi:hypothetical protein